MRIRVSISTKPIALLLFLAHCPSPEGWNIEPYGRLTDPELVESSGRRVGFNMMFVGGQRELVSWTPLTLRFSWDSPSFWGLLEME